MRQQSDTIAAISTPAGEGAIGIVRISGPEAFVIADKVFQLKTTPRKKNQVDRKLYYGCVVDANGEEVDDGFVVRMGGPGSYTGEDSVEIYCHGGLLVTTRVLETILNFGAGSVRLAAPGEFTERAFINGKLDLTQAEAVIDVIKASTDGALRSARTRLCGTLSKEIDSIKSGLIDLRVQIEASLDFPEEELNDSPEEALLIQAAVTKGVDKALKSIKNLLATYDEGRVLRDGIRVLILGRPNVGKSSLLNLLLRFERAIVTHLPGTTRDLIEEPLNIRSIPVRLIDTAGLRETADMVESLGIEAARAQIESADILLFVTDLSTPECFGQDKKIVDEIHGKKVLIVGNKRDISLAASFSELKETFSGIKSIAISALPINRETLPGLLNEEQEKVEPSATKELEEAIFSLATGRTASGTLPGLFGSAVITKLRHKRSLEDALVALLRARSVLDSFAPTELFATDLLMAVNSLGEVTGAVTTEDILTKIFREFCIGK